MSCPGARFGGAVGGGDLSFELTKLISASSNDLFSPDSDFVPPYSMSPQHAGMMSGAMPPMRVPSGAGGPRTGPIRGGPMSRGDYGKSMQFF